MADIVGAKQTQARCQAVRAIEVGAPERAGDRPGDRSSDQLLLVLMLGVAGCAASHSSEHGHAHPHGSGDHSHAQAQMPHRFEDADRWSRVFDNPERDAWQKPQEVVDKIELAPGMIVADLGAGTGYFLRYLSAAVGESGRVLALDIEQDMIRFMKERIAREKLGNVEAQVIAPDDPGLAAGSVDRILIVDTWHHIGERAAYTKKLAAALRAGGSVVIVDFTMETERGPPKHHRIAPETIIAELGAAGLDAAVIEESLPDQYIVVGRAR